MTQFFKKLFNDVIKGKVQWSTPRSPYPGPLHTPVITPQEPKLEPKWKVKVSPRFNGNFNRAYNHEYVDFSQLNLIPESKEKVWIYNVSEVTHTLSNSIVRKLVAEGVKGDEDYTVSTSIPRLIKIPKVCIDSGHVDTFVLEDGRRVAMDLIDSDNCGLDQDADIKYPRMSTGKNFGEQGVFWSTNNPPLKKEIKAAKKRLNNYYKRVVEKVDMARTIMAADSVGVTLEEYEKAKQYLSKTQETQ